MAFANPETRLHAAAVRYLRTVCPDCVAFHVPNGGYRSKETARLMKALGVLAGVFDLVLLAPPNKAFPLGRTFFLEAKADHGRLSEEQQWFKGELIKMGFPYVVFKSLDDIRDFILQNNIPHRLAEQAARMAAA